MRTLSVSALLLAALVPVACGSDDATGGQQQNNNGPFPTGGAYTGTGAVPNGLGGSTVANGGATVANGGATVANGGSTGVGLTPGSGGVPGAGGGPDPGNGGFPTGTGGDPGGVGGVPPGGTGGTPSIGKGTPVIPAVAGECPTWKSGVISFMGLGNITIAAGAKQASPTAPALIYWHGTLSSSSEFNIMAAPVAQGVQQQGGVIVSFQDTTGGDLNSGTNIFGVGDLKLVDQLVACAVKDYNIDPRKIYVMGCSAGGLFSVATAAMRSAYIAAAAPNSGGSVVPAAFQNEHTPPLMTVHGAPGQDVVAVDFSQTSATADKAFKARGGFVIDCNTGGGHCGGGPLAGDAWKFFQAHPFGVDPEPWAGGLPAGFSSQCKIQ